MGSKKIVIDAGHGGSDPGATGNGIVEKDYTLLISNYIYNRLKELGADVSITRSDNETLTPSQRVRRILGFYGNGTDVIVVSNHINAGGGKGAEIIYSLRNNDDFAKLISKELESSGQNVRKYYQRRLPSNPSRDYYFILRDTANNESVIVEYAFVDNIEDANNLKTDWQKYAEAVVRAIAKYINIPIEENNTYIVKSGDTLWSIAKKNSISVSELKEYNNLNSNLLKVGQLLYLSPKETPVTEDDKIVYIVEKGDTLYKISNKYNVPIDSIKNLNNLTSDSLIVGQKLIIKSSPLDDDTSNKYVVKQGDNLYAISKMYNISVDKLKQANGLSSDILSIGQKLTIPTEQDSYGIYTVKKGDTLYSIARMFNTTVTNLQTINNLSTSILTTGQQLLVPKK